MARSLVRSRSSRSRCRTLNGQTRRQWEFRLAEASVLATDPILPCRSRPLRIARQCRRGSRGCGRARCFRPRLCGRRSPVQLTPHSVDSLNRVGFGYSCESADNAMVGYSSVGERLVVVQEVAVQHLKPPRSGEVRSFLAVWMLFFFPPRSVSSGLFGYSGSGRLLEITACWPGFSAPRSSRPW